MSSHSPLPAEQEELRHRKLENMTDEQLVLWIEACEIMERWVTFSKARRTWKRAREATVAEIGKREEKARRRAENS